MISNKKDDKLYNELIKKISNYKKKSTDTKTLEENKN
jgi:hypothetical protein